LQKLPSERRAKLVQPFGIEKMNQIMEFLSKQNWGAILQGIGAIWVAIVATVALTQWKKQIKLQQHLDLINQLTDEIHKFMLAASPVVNSIKYIKIGFKSFSSTNRKYKHIKHNGMISFIEKHGNKQNEKMIKQIVPLKKSLSKISSLSAKGQMYGINNYAKAMLSIKKIEHIFGQIEAFTYFIGNTDLNWHHPDVQKTLFAIAEIDEEHIYQNLAEQNIEYLKFAKKLYRKI